MMIGTSPPLSSRRSLALSYFRAPENRGGFTLIELLIVVAILAILAVVVITLNPAQLIKQSRDSTRLQDIGTMNRVLGIYQSDGGTSLGTSSVVYVSIPDPAATTTQGSDCTTLGLPTLPSSWTYHCAASSTYRNINGLGWIPVNFTQISFGNPLPILPVDPINTTSTGEYYTYATGESWELTTLIESDKYAGLAVNDGDSYPGVYSKRSSSVPLTPGTRDRGLVGYWPFDEGSGAAIHDSSGSGRNGSGNQGWAAGKVGGAADFTGSQSISVGSNPVLTDSISFTAWIYPYAIITGDIIGFANYQPTWGYCFIVASGGPFCLNFQDSGSAWRNKCSSSTITAPMLNQWHFIAVTHNGLTTTLFLDGALNASYSNPYHAGMSANSLNLGGAGWYGFNGRMDDVRMYNRALSAAEILAIYNATK